ncbi:pyruvate dehydrogenase (acetyl-transferring) E1 component subunit alpha [Haloarcula hispanica]|uniref:Pyruvate dehydrogenase (Acetyl-transferring) E1 component subunit alpha n=1 Tax=Haloarcula hispanica TaxID=51589 RepID=A0A5J5LHE0_HALHI|nr:pyruvate dehydrogenase (acetyl-transferring) E1 component subunit alpha [Haloarcula hispanica]KAA9409239.1 pyruvate dehydrogenase (acetyl-transferring) E1 component subunit alpha [Haloarcula hispanica]
MATDVLDRAYDDQAQALDADGEIVDPDLIPDLSDEKLVSMYRDMRFARQFDERMISLQRQGRLGTYSSLAGQEGSQVGSTYALADEDTIFYQYREHGALVARGLPWEYVLYWMGHEAGNAALGDVNVFPLNISIGAHLPHAVGWSWAAKRKGDERAGVVHFGDGATSEGDFHEAMNFAGVFETPTVFFCNNNQWAISVPRERQTASQTLAQKADAYGFDGVQVDGMDPLATYTVTEAARERAVGADGQERGPVFIEAVQYRFGAHTTADDPDVYRDDAEVEQWRERDPLDRMERFLRNCNLLDDEKIDVMDDTIDEQLGEIIDNAEAHAAEPTDLFTDVYAESTQNIDEQQEYFEALRERHGDDALLESE